MKITIDKSSFGDEGSVYEGHLGMMNHYRLQLLSYRKQQKTPEERAYLEADIAGYESVLESKSQKNAEVFMKNKRDENHRQRFANNTELVNWLKAQGLWEEKP